jgi:hypothetical protein
MQTIKLSEQTLRILKNFSTINPGLVVKPGAKLVTMSPASSVFAEAEINETLTTPFALTDISKFLSALSLFPEPELNFKETSVEIIKDKQKIVFVYADPRHILAPTKEFKAPNFDLTFSVKEETLMKLFKTMSVLALPAVIIEGDGKTLSISTKDVKSSTSHSYTEELGPTDQTFKHVFLAENMKMVPGHYDISIAPGVGRFVAKDPYTGKPITYYIAIETPLKK